jgi:phosphoenolpyruvate synthase/pyruvate phosphate dikinase
MPYAPAPQRKTLPTASFAGQQDTYLNIIGKEAILKHISKCWASLFTERAVTYRFKMDSTIKKSICLWLFSRWSSRRWQALCLRPIPSTSNRKVLSIDASFGLGEALVSGLVNADNYKVS